MSIKAMIVDDEHLVRALIRLGTDWEANGFEIIGEADSGKTAIDFMRNNVPDVLFTDICMPFMDGLELSERVR
ncbi:MAG TPA: response regulator, partial [Candidatus Nitrosocosmicus sp.]|nr:response regulator [Candidatus Nitrosocosmicus sp.]